MFEEDYDDELPSISSNVFSNDLKDFSMPPADVLASQRAHQEQCEQELRQLRSHYDKLEMEGPVMQADDSSSSDSVASLSGAASDLPGTPQYSSPTAVAVIERLANALCDCDIIFLSNYLQVLHSSDENVITAVSQEIVSDIESAIVNGKDGNSALSGSDVVVLCGWLSAATVWGTPRVPGARKLLLAILSEQSMETVDAVGAALGSALASAEALVGASDAALGPAAQHRRLAGRLLAAALDALAPPSPPPPPDPAAPSVRVLCERLRAVWRRLDANAQRAALLLAGRVAARAADELEGGDREALRQFLALVLQTPPAGHRHTPDHFKVLVAASKLQTLFGVNM